MHPTKAIQEMIDYIIRAAMKLVLDVLYGSVQVPNTIYNMEHSSLVLFDPFQYIFW